MIHRTIANKLLLNIEQNREYKDRTPKLNKDDIANKMKEYERSKGKTKDIDDAIVELGYLTREEVSKELAKAYDVEYVNLLDPSCIISYECVSLFKKEVIRKYRIVPYKIEDDSNGSQQVVQSRLSVQSNRKDIKTVYIATSNPIDVQLHDMLAALLKNEYKVVFNYCDEESLSQFLSNYFSEMIRGDIEFDDIDDDVGYENNTESYNIDESSSKIMQIVNEIFANAIQLRASDIHVLPKENSVEIKFRIDGSLIKGTELSLRDLNPIINRIKTMGGMDIANKREPLDGRITITAGGKGIDMRVSTVPTVFGEKAVIRLLDKQNIRSGLGDVGFRGSNIEHMKMAMKHPAGIILVTGPTGSGKSTTLYTVLSLLMTPEVNIITVEDPVEYKIDGLTQMQVNEAANLTFANGLRASLRQDPDIIMVGEIRDLETGQTAIQAANTGHLVLSTLHTNDALSSISRLADMGLETFMIAEYLACVTSQRLVKKLCDCKREEYLAPDAPERKVYNLGDGEFKHWVPVGCQRCNNTGYRGRVALQEVIYINDDMKEAIHNHVSQRELIKIAKSYGMWFMKDDVLDKIKSGDISFESASKYIIR